MAQLEDLGKKRRRSWYVTLVLSALYAASAVPVIKLIGFLGIFLYPAIFLGIAMDGWLKIGEHDSANLLAILDFSFCLVVVRFFYWFFAEDHDWFNEVLR